MPDPGYDSGLEKKICHNDVIGTMDEWNKTIEETVYCVNQHCIS